MQGGAGSRYGARMPPKLWDVTYAGEKYVVADETALALRRLLDRGGHDTFTFTPEGQTSPVTINVGPSVAIALEETEKVAGKKSS